MVAAKATALAMRSIAAATPATTSNVVLRLMPSFPSALVTLQAIEASYMPFSKEIIPPIVLLLANNFLEHPFHRLR
jgi:hypothetical protein